MMIGFIGRPSYPTDNDSRAVCPHGCFPFLSPNRPPSRIVPEPVEIGAAGAIG